MRVIVSNDSKTICYEIDSKRRMFNGSKFKKRTTIISKILNDFNVNNIFIYPEKSKSLTGTAYKVCTGNKEIDIIKSRIALITADILSFNKLGSKSYKREVLDLIEAVADILNLKTVVLG